MKDKIKKLFTSNSYVNDKIWKNFISVSHTLY